MISAGCFRIVTGTPRSRKTVSLGLPPENPRWMAAFRGARQWMGPLPAGRAQPADAQAAKRALHGGIYVPY